LRAAREGKGPAIARLESLPATSGLSQEAITGLKGLARDLAALTARTSPWDLLTGYLLDCTEMGRAMARAAGVRERMQNVAVWQFLNFLREHIPVGRGAPIHRVLERVRQLVLLSEERDLRQVPAPALHVDAVRLMTVHGSKGLEFEAVHLPGLALQSFPLSYRGQRCPPPEGLVSGGEGLTVSEEAKRSHLLEEECLFFVAISRARTYLRLYRPRFYLAGRPRAASEFLGRLSQNLIHETASPPVVPLPPGAPRPMPIALTLPASWVVSDQRLELYQKCPRRFFYTHILGMGGARRTTAFSRTHDCLYELIRWLAAARIDAEPGIVEAEVAFETIWQDLGPGDHAFAADYRALASRLVGALVKAGAGRRFRRSEPLAVDLATGRVLVEPNEIAELGDGTIVLRRVRTGYRTTEEYDGLEYSLYHLAGAAHFGRGFAVEALHLTDETLEAVTISPKKLGKKRGETEDILAGIKGGLFPPKIGPVTCPRCPHFFVCAATPKGPLVFS
jgi:hypothetical protein